MNFLSAACAAPAPGPTLAPSADPSFDWFEYRGDDAVFRDSAAGPGEYRNPILTGFYPDPSITRAGDEFYLVNSNASIPATDSFMYGPPNTMPISGDWDGDGKESIGIYHTNSGDFFLTDVNVMANAQYVFTFGPAKMLPRVRSGV